MCSLVDRTPSSPCCQVRDARCGNASEGMSNPSKHPVLLVDDDPSIRATRASALLSAGYDVDTATGGFDALLHLKRAVPAR